MRENNNRKQTLTAYFVVLIGFFVILFPLLYYRENYLFTVHDYLDIWPSLFEVLRRSGLFFSPDSSMPIMDGMSTCYLYFDFGAYRFLNFIFGSVWGEIANKAISLGVGFYTARRFFAYVFENTSTGELSGNTIHKSMSSEEWVIILLAGAYAFTSVYPNWTISFAFLPLYLEMLFRIIREEDKFNIKRGLLFLFFGFLVYFPSIGFFLFGVYFVALLIDTIKNKKIKRTFFLYVIIMLASIMITNINILIYVLRGDEINRSLIETDITQNKVDLIKSMVKTMIVVGIEGQYHAAPVLYILIPLCAIGYVALFFQLFRKNDLKDMAFPTIIAGIIVIICIFYTLDSFRITRYITSKILPILAGFNLGRVVYLNNILWFILFLVIFKRLDKTKMTNAATFLILTVNVCLVIMYPGNYKETSANYFRERFSDGKASFAEFYDTEYFESLKNDIEYDYEGLISVGYHPAVAMFNGFNTLDGYVSIHPLDYHYRFREIIAPSLDAYPDLAEYYDTWGGRMYCFIDESKDVAPKRVAKDEARDLLINIDAFYDMGGRYIFSMYELSNADDLGLYLVEHKTDMESSLYQTWVYKVGRDS